MPSIAAGSPAEDYLPASVLAELPCLSDGEAVLALNEIGLAPDPDELAAAYRRHHRATPESSAVLLALQLLVRAGRHGEQREIAEWACVGLGSVSRVVERLEALGLVAVAGGAPIPGRPRRSCCSYRLTWSSAVELRPHRLVQARAWVWARTAGVPAPEASRCLRGRRHTSLPRLHALVMASQSKAAAAKGAAAAGTADSNTGALRPSPAVGAVSIGEIIRGKVEQTSASSQKLFFGSKWNEGKGNSKQGLDSPESAHEAETSALPGETKSVLEAAWAEQRHRLFWIAARAGDNAPQSTWRMVLKAAQRRGVALAAAVDLYERCTAEARVEGRIGNVRKPAAWAAAGFRRQIAEVGT